MDSPKAKGKKGLISKTWERCKSFSGRSKAASSSGNEALKMKSKSWPRNLTVNATPSDHDHREIKKKKWSPVAPEGCFSIYVGPEKQRFVIKTECVNHHLFKTLLEEAESEYGYSSEGPLMLPCQVHHFIKVLMEMDSEETSTSIINGKYNKGSNFVARSHSSNHHLFTPPRFSNPCRRLIYI